MKFLMYLIAILTGIVAALWVVVILQTLDIIGPIPVP
jgi:hypothetical protein